MVVVAIVQAADITQVAVRQYSCRTIYHSPQTPGYTEGSVVVLDDGSLFAGLGAVVDVLRCRPTGFLQRSTDSAKSWAHRNTCLRHAPADLPNAHPSTRDGRLLVMGGQLPLTRPIGNG